MGTSETFQRPDLETGNPDSDAIDKNIQDANNDAAERLVSAAAAGEIGDVRKLVARIGLECAAPIGRYAGLMPLMVAALSGRAEVVSLLIERNAALESIDP